VSFSNNIDTPLHHLHFYGPTIAFFLPGDGGELLRNLAYLGSNGGNCVPKTFKLTVRIISWDLDGLHEPFLNQLRAVLNVLLDIGVQVFEFEIEVLSYQTTFLTLRTELEALCTTEGIGEVAERRMYNTGREERSKLVLQPYHESPAYLGGVFPDPKLLPGHDNLY
jgi:hypothetical protein